MKSPSPENGEGLAAGRFAVLHLGAVAAQINDPEKLALLKHKEELEQTDRRAEISQGVDGCGRIPASNCRQFLIELAKTQEALDK